MGDDRKSLLQSAEDSSQLARIENRRSPPTQINGINCFRQCASKFRGRFRSFCDVVEDTRNVGFVGGSREHVRSEIAVAAFGPAERHRNVEAQSHPVLYSMGPGTLSPPFDNSRGALRYFETTMKRVVITGMGVVSPNGIGKDAFCRAILAGTSGVKRITRFDPAFLPVHIAGEIQNFDELAWVDARERKHVSRSVPLAVAASAEAIADAGLAPQAMSQDEKRQIGVILGTGGGAQEVTEEQYRLWHTGHEKQASVFCIPSGTMGTLSSEISMRFGFRGPSHVVTTNCTSSTDALGYALDEIRIGTVPILLAGGVDVPISPATVKGYTLLRALTPSWNDAPERASRPFSADRDGFVLAEGAWMFLLEEYEHAVARGARIYAEIAGYGCTCEAFHRVRLSESAEEPARAIMLALDEAGLAAEDIQYVNLHGTST